MMARVWYLISAQTSQEGIKCKGGSMEEIDQVSPYLNLNFLFMSLCVYLFKKCPSQFLSNRELVEVVFCNKERLPYKNQNQSLTLSSLVGKFKFAVW